MQELFIPLPAKYKIIEVRSGSNPGEGAEVSIDDLKKRYIKYINGQPVNSQIELFNWAANGRIGSHFQCDERMYVKIPPDCDDVFIYYKVIEEKKVILTGPIWGSSYFDLDNNRYNKK